jgi:hypothetical protein
LFFSLCSSQRLRPVAAQRHCRLKGNRIDMQHTQIITNYISPLCRDPILGRESATLRSCFTETIKILKAESGLRLMRRSSTTSPTTKLVPGMTACWLAGRGSNPCHYYQSKNSKMAARRRSWPGPKTRTHKPRYLLRKQQQALTNFIAQHATGT